MLALIRLSFCQICEENFDNRNAVKKGKEELDGAQSRAGGLLASEVDD